MNPVKQQIYQAIDAGERKADVFARFCPPASSPRQKRKIAFWIASHPSPSLLQQHRRLIIGTAWLMAFQALLAALAVWGVSEEVGSIASSIIGVLALVLTAFFAWGFYRPLLGAYTGFIVLSLTQIPRALPDLMHEPLATGVGLAINIGMLAYIWHVRSKLFPDIVFFGPKKVHGVYQFAD